MFPMQIELMVRQEARRQVHRDDREPLARPTRWPVPRRHQHPSRPQPPR